jgi:hypothetical protein
MNWKNILYLLRVERKSGRLIRGVKATKYKENKLTAYWPYWVAAVIGILGGLLADFIAGEIYADPQAASFLPPLDSAAATFFVTMPTLVLLFSIVLSMLQQIQLSGVKAATQVMYWLPITWKEQTTASILANLLGFPLAITIGVAAGLITFSALSSFYLLGWALATSIIMFAAAFLGSATTEIIRVLQTRFVGAVYKSSGKAAVWIRFAGSLVFFVIFYILYFALTQGFNTFIQGLSAFQSTIWFVPFVWPGLALFYFLSNSFAFGALFLALSVAFVAAMLYLAIYLNERFGLYEPPAIKVQTSGVYAPKTGLLGKFGFSSVEAALIRKDVRAFTRRRELIGIFITPIVFIILPISQSLGSGAQGVSEVSLMFSAMLFLFPAGLMAMSMGNMLIGEEGIAVWRIFTSPITPKNYVKAKLTFLTAMSVLVAVVTGIVAVLFYNPSIKFIVAGFVEAMLLIAAIGPIALAIGFKGADFTVSRRPRMIRQEWALISLVVCGLAGLAVLAPLIPYAIAKVIPGFFLSLTAQNVTDLILPLAISGVIAAVISAIFYRINIGSAKELFRKAEN